MRPTSLATPLTVGLVLGGAALLVGLNLGTAPGHPLHVPTYAVSLAGKYLCYAILALAVDLVWGLGTLHCLTQQEPAPQAAAR